MLLTCGDVMKFIVDVSFPLGPFNTLCPLGHGREKVGDRHFPVEPELVYFTTTA